MEIYRLMADQEEMEYIGVDCCLLHCLLTFSFIVLMILGCVTILFEMVGYFRTYFCYLVLLVCLYYHSDQIVLIAQCSK